MHRAPFVVRALLAIAALAAGAVGACGEIVILPENSGEASAGAGDGSLVDDSATGTARADTVAQDGAAGDAVGTAVDASGATDGAAGDAPASDCETDFDCVGLEGATACRKPRCQKGVCALVDEPTGAPCKDAKLKGGDCSEARCSDKAVCELMPAPDGKPCGFGACGNKCTTGQCVPTAAADYDDGNPCTKDFCDQGQVVVHEPISDASLACDDGDGCTQDDACDGGKCKGGALDCGDGIACTVDACESKTGCSHTANSDKCDDGNGCSVETCDLASGCTVTGANAGVACDDGNACTKADACTAVGACVGEATCGCTAEADCPADNLCLPMQCVASKCVADPAQAVQCGPGGGACATNACDPKSGKCALQPKQEGKPCDDANKCTTATVCTTGTCGSGKLVACDDKNPCTADSCSAATGCTFKAAPGACDDANKCTTGDACAAGACGGAKVPCDDGLACTLDGCDKATGKCVNKPQDELCDDKNSCTADSCVEKTGCAFGPQANATCDDGNPCTQDTCTDGKCTGVNVCQCVAAADCDDGNPCTQDACGEGKCTATAAPQDGKACSSGAPCLVADSGQCKAGTCTGGKPVDCSAQAGPCVATACSPATNKCEVVAKSDGTGCDADGKPCTVGDACKAGACVAGKPLDCSQAGDACNTAACAADDKGGAVCAKTAKPTGTACDDGLYCTDKDACAAGTCKAGAPKACGTGTVCAPVACAEDKNQCAVSPAAASVVCDDGQFCSIADHCDGKGGCIGGAPKVCDGGICKLGSCNESTDACTTQAAPLGSPCEDGNACSTGDVCGATACTAGTLKSCLGDACTLASCDPKTGQCVPKPKPTGTACSDGDACTDLDACDAAGKCAPGKAKTCTASVCTLGVCDSQTGACATPPKPDGTLCEDGNSCTSKDNCSGGVCKGTYTCACKPGELGACDDKNGCTADTCVLSGTVYVCKNAPSVGALCADGQACTAGDACDANGACVGKLISCDDKNACTVDACDPATGKCMNKPDVGVKCTDGNACTTGDVCGATGACTGTATVCNDGNLCTDDGCDVALGTCIFKHNIAACSDGNACTAGDVCTTGKCAAGVPKVCNDLNPCSNDGCDVFTGACTVTANAVACSDGNPCTLSDTCMKLQCIPGKSVNCEDGNPCTDDPCSLKTGACSHVFNSIACSDGNNCSGPDTCSGGQCIGLLKFCFDGNVCTNDSCNSITGACVFAPNTAACSDGNACSLGDFCSGGACQVGPTAKTCFDGNTCTSDACNAKLGCSFPPVANGLICGPAYTCGFLKKCYPKCFGGICEKDLLL